MRRVLSWLAVFTVCSAMPAPAHEGDTWLGVQVGRPAVSGEFHEVLRTGFEGSLELTHMETERLGVGWELGYHRLGVLSGADFGPPEYFASGGNYELSALQTTAHAFVDFRPDGTVRPYGKLGGGLYWLSVRRLSPWGSETELQERLGYSVGAGVYVGAAAARDFGLGGTYHAILVDGKRWDGLLTLGVTLKLSRPRTR